MGYLESFILGLSLAAVPGPAFFEVVRRSLSRGFRHGFMMGLADTVATAVKMTLALLGLTQLLLFTPMKLVLFAAGATILAWLGLSALKVTASEIGRASASHVSGRDSFAVGLALAIFSPIGIAFDVSVAGSFLSSYGFSEALANSLAVAAGPVVFFAGLSAFINYTRHKIRNGHLVWLSRIFGTVLLFYAAFFAFQAAKLMGF